MCLFINVFKNAGVLTGGGDAPTTRPGHGEHARGERARTRRRARKQRALPAPKAQRGRRATATPTSATLHRERVPAGSGVRGGPGPGSQHRQHGAAAGRPPGRRPKTGGTRAAGFPCEPLEGSGAEAGMTGRVGREHR